MKIDTNLIIDQLCEKEFAIVDNFLSITDFHALSERIKEDHINQQLIPARIGPLEKVNTQHDIRRDKICWIETSSPETVFQPYYTAITKIIKALNESLYLGIHDIEMHFAIYQPGDFYKLHIDQFKTDKKRQISCVYYLNAHWVKAYGGELELYDINQNPLQTVLPESNRFVCFRSHLPHEVKTTYEKRYSLTGWLKTR